MRIFQLLVTLQNGDAIGNNAMLLADMLRGEGHSVVTYAYNIGKGFVFGQNGIDSIDHMPTPSQDDLVLYHLCESTPLNAMVKGWNCKKIAVYHNVTPPKFFAWLDEGVAQRQRQSLQEVASLKDTFDMVVAVSEFNRQDLIRMGYAPEQVVTIPILIRFEDYKRKPDPAIIQKYKDGKVNILFVGRVAPNKKQEDILRTYAWYKQHISDQVRLILVGSPFSQRYMDLLQQYAAIIRAEDVVFTGHITFEEILGLYCAADVFLCMSEHEGFCVPLVEAMLFDTPVVAYNSTAISYTLGGSGVLLNLKHPELAAKAIHRIVTDDALKNAIIEGQRKRLNDFEPDTLAKQLLQVIEGVVK